jgi:hypothetical protein
VKKHVTTTTSVCQGSLLALIIWKTIIVGLYSPHKGKKARQEKERADKRQDPVKLLGGWA